MQQTRQRTPLFEIHGRLGARLVDFAGWEMPISYEGILAEHRAVRERAGMFDVSHMGEFHVRGRKAGAFLDAMVTNSVQGMEDGQALYTPMCNPAGGTVDDLIVYRLRGDHFMTVVNASNIDKDLTWLQSHTGDWEVTIEDVSAVTALLAVQGPRAVDIVAAGSGDPVQELGYYRFRTTTLWGVEGLVARLGYTGEDGFELMVPAAHAADVWTGAMDAGEKRGLQPTGLGARDTLRFEAGYCLYGHELNDTTSPLEAGIGWTVKLEKGKFMGADVLRAQKDAGPPRRLVGLRIEGGRVPRQGAAVIREQHTIGTVTSGMFAPTLEEPAALALVERGSVRVGDQVELDLKGRRYPARVASKPFYKRS